MSILNNILNFFKPKKKITIEIDAETLRNNQIIKGMANQTAEDKSTIAKLTSELGKIRESERDKNEEGEVKYELNKRKKELQRKVYPKYFSLRSFFNKLSRDKKFRDKLGFYTFDRSKKLANFGDIGFTSDFQLVLLDDKGEVLVRNEELKKIFQSAGGLGNDINDGKIVINFDADGAFIPNIILDEVSDITPTADGRFKYTKVRKKPVYEHINELRDEISDNHSYIEEMEETNTK